VIFLQKKIINGIIILYKKVGILLLLYMSENSIDILAHAVEIDNPELIKKQEEMHANIELYYVQPNDTIASIAQKYHISNYDDLLALNRFMNNNLEVSGKNGSRIFIKAWSESTQTGNKVFVPKDIQKFQNDIVQIKKIADFIIKNEQVAKWDVKALKNEINEWIYPIRPQSFGIKFLGAFIASQENTFDPRLPRIVDPTMERSASCSHFAKMFLTHSNNMSDLNEWEKKLLNTKDIDAWIFPKEIMKIGFIQKQNLMKYFNPGLLTSWNPIQEENREEYKKGVIDYGKYLEEKWVPGSFMPLFFKYSKYKWVISDYNMWEKEKHYNTHMSIYAGIANMKFVAWEVWEVKNWKIIPFGHNEEILNNELSILQSDIMNTKISYTQWKIDLVDALKIENNPTIQKKMNIIDDVIIDRYIRWINNPIEKETRKIKLQKLFETENFDRIKTELPSIIHFPVTDDDTNYIIVLQSRRRRIQNEFKEIQNLIYKNNSWDYKKIDTTDYNDILVWNDKLFQAINLYNNDISSINLLKEQITKKEKFIKDINDRKLKNIPEWKISVIDYLANFLQQRGDYGSIVMTDIWRKQMIDGMQKYASLIHLKINWKEIDIAKEFDPKKQDKIQVVPTDIIEISGPMMIDWLHMVNSDTDRKEKMNARTRFFFEFVASGVFLPTELLEPNKDSNFVKEKYGKITDNLKVKWVYDVRYKLNEDGTILVWKTGSVFSENIEQILKKQIPIFEKEVFSKLDVNSPTYHREYNTLIQKYYWLQIKALQMMWFMESEDRTNPWATNINRIIPYFDTTNIYDIFKQYIASVKQQEQQENETMAPFKEYTHIKVYNWDTTARLHNRLVQNILSSKDYYKKYSNLWVIEDLNDYLKWPLWKEIIVRGIQRNSKKQQDLITEEDFNSGKLKPGTSIIIHFKDLDEIIGSLKDISYTKNISQRLSQIDNDVIDTVITTEQNRNIIKNILFIETYEYDNKKWFIPMWAGKFTKLLLQDYPILQKIKSVSSIWDFQIRWIDSLGSGFKDEWIRQDQLQKALNKINEPWLQKYLEVDNKNIKEDLKKITQIRDILKKTEFTKENMSIITDNLNSIIRIDSGDWSNIVGKIIGTSLLNDKINTHFQKLQGVLTIMSEPIDSFRDNPIKMNRFEDGIIFINNKWEKVANLWFMENYMYRILENTQILEKWWVNLTHNKVEFEQMWWQIGKAIIPDAIGKRSIKYDTNIFIENIIKITDQIILSQKNFQGTVDEKLLISKLATFGEKVRNISNQFKRDLNVIEWKKFHPTTSNYTVPEIGWKQYKNQILVQGIPETIISDNVDASWIWNILVTKDSIGNKKIELWVEKTDLYMQRDADIFHEIFAFVWNEEVKNLLEVSSIDSSFLPTKEEWSWKDEFRYPFFSYIRKTISFQNELSWSENTENK